MCVRTCVYVCACVRACVRAWKTVCVRAHVCRRICLLFSAYEHVYVHVTVYPPLSHKTNDDFFTIDCLVRRCRSIPRVEGGLYSLHGSLTARDQSALVSATHPHFPRPIYLQLLQLRRIYFIANTQNS